MILMSLFPNLLEYMCADNYFNTKGFDKNIANIKWFSFLDSQCTFYCTTCTKSWHYIFLCRVSQGYGNELWLHLGVRGHIPVKKRWITQWIVGQAADAETRENVCYYVPLKLAW